MTVTGTKAHWESASVTSAATTAVTQSAMQSVVAAEPRIKGKVQVGRKLTAVPGAWTPAGVTFTYQWMRGNKVVRAATGKTYKLTKKDVGKKIRVVVTGSKSGYNPASATSKQTKKVKPRI